MDVKITEDNYIGVAMHFYDNMQCNTLEDFETDLNRVVCIKKIIDKYNSSANVNLRLLLNHIIILYNSFGKISVDMIRLKLDNSQLPVVKPILIFLGYIDGDTWNDVIEDSRIFNMLRRI